MKVSPTMAYVILVIGIAAADNMLKQAATTVSYECGNTHDLGVNTCLMVTVLGSPKDWRFC